MECTLHESTILPIFPADVGCISCTFSRFTKSTNFFMACFTPILTVNTLLYTPMKGGIGPIPHAFHQAMLNGVVMEVIHVPRIIPVISDHMFPVSALPDGRFVSFPFAGIQPRLTQQCGAALFSDEAFDHRPTFTEVRIIRRQGPDAMEMVRQQHPSVNGKRTDRSNLTDGLTQGGPDMFVAQKKLLPSVGYYCEKIGAARCFCPPIS